MISESVLVIVDHWLIYVHVGMPKTNAIIRFELFQTIYGLVNHFPDV